MRLSNTLRKSVLVTNNETGENLTFSSMTEAGEYLGISRVSVAPPPPFTPWSESGVNKYLLNNIAYKEYTISKVSWSNKEMAEKSSGCSNLNNAKVSQQAVLLTNKETSDIKEFSSLTPLGVSLGDP